MEYVPAVHVWLPSDALKQRLNGLEEVSLEVVESWSPQLLPQSRGVVETVVPPQDFSGDFSAIAQELPSLRFVQTLSVGVEQYSGALPPHARLYNAAGVHSDATSEWVVAAVLACERQLLEFDHARTARTWAPAASKGLMNSRVLILGAGEIGCKVAERLAAFGAKVTLFARTARPGALSASQLHDALPSADVVVLTLPLTDQTRRFVDRPFLHAMKDGSLLVNAARGQVVDSEALVRELTSGRIRAALDVFDPEPPPPDHPIWALPGVLITPHVASSVPGAIDRLTALLADRLPRFARGEEVPGIRAHGY